jgi:hypothetical protein
LIPKVGRYHSNICDKRFLPDENLELPDNGAKDILTTSFLPSTPGNLKHYEEEFYEFQNGRVTGQSKIFETHGQKGDFTVKRTLRNPGLPDAHDTLKGHRRVVNGYAEMVYIDGNNRQNEFRLLHGAKQGDQWGGSVEKGKFVFIRFQTIKGHGNNGPYDVIRAVVERQWIGINGGGELVELITEYILEKGDGIQSQTSYMVLRGQKRVIGRKRLISSSRQ